jgi:hypothetical protein
VTVTAPAPHLRVAISAPRPGGRIGVALRYRVSVTGTGAHGARRVRLCAPPVRTLIDVRAPGTFADRGARCRDIRRLEPGRTVSFELSGIPAAHGRLTLTARASAVGLPHALRAQTHAAIAGPKACAAALRPPRC